MLGAVHGRLPAEDALIHPLDNTACVGLAEMGIPLDHGQGLMPQHLGDLHEAGPIHGQVRSCTVPQVVEAAILDASSLESGIPRIPHTGTLRACVEGKYAVRVKAAHLGMLPEEVEVLGVVRQSRGPAQRSYTTRCFYSPCTPQASARVHRH